MRSEPCASAGISLIHGRRRSSVSSNQRSVRSPAETPPSASRASCPRTRSDVERGGLRRGPSRAVRLDQPGAVRRRTRRLRQLARPAYRRLPAPVASWSRTGSMRSHSPRSGFSDAIPVSSLVPTRSTTDEARFARGKEGCSGFTRISRRADRYVALCLLVQILLQRKLVLIKEVRLDRTQCQRSQ